MIKTVVMSIDEIQAGAITADTVVDAGGRVLVPAGVELSEAMLSGLKRREIEELAVLVEVAESSAEADAYRSRVRSQLEHLFRQAGSEPETLALFDTVLAYRMEHRS